MFGFNRASFRESSHTGYFINRNMGGDFTSPVTVITRVALKQVAEGAELPLPEGYTMEVVDNVYWMSGYADKDFNVTHRQATEIRDIGEGIMRLDEEGMIQPPLAVDEKDSIRHLIETVARAEERIRSS